MTIFIAKEINGILEVNEYNVVGETDKQYKVYIDENTLKKVNKTMINCATTEGVAYALSSEKAIGVFKDSVRNKIDDHKYFIRNLERQLTMEQKINTL